MQTRIAGDGDGDVFEGSFGLTLLQFHDRAAEVRLGIVGIELKGMVEVAHRLFELVLLQQVPSPGNPVIRVTRRAADGTIQVGQLLQPDDVLAILFGEIFLPRRGVRFAAVQVVLDVVGLQGDCLREVFGGFGVQAGLLTGQAAIVPGVDVLVVQLDGFRERGDRVIEVLGLQQGKPAIVVSVDVLRIDPKCRVEVLDRQLMLSAGNPDQSAVVVRLGVVEIEADCVVEVLLGLLVLLAGQVEVAPRVSQTRVVSLQFNRLAEVGDGRESSFALANAAAR